MATRNDRAVVELVLNGEQAKTSLKTLSVEVTKARSSLLRMQEADNPALYKAKVAEYHKLIAAQRQMRGAIDDTTTAWGRFKKEAATVMTGVLGGNIATAGLQALANLIPSTIDKTLKLSDSFADMAKVTGLSTDKVKELNKEIKGIDTRTANKDLRDIAVAGGQLGVPNEQLLSFVKNADMAVVALGDEFSGGVEQVAKELGGVAKLFKETKDMDIGEALSRIGSGMNELGAAGSATAPVVTEFVTRLGQLGSLAPNLAQTAGYGAALQELGMTAEIAASGLGKILMVGANQSDLFAQHLGKTKEEVEALINSNPDGFLKELAKSFQGLTQTQVVQRMKELKLESDEAIKVMSLLANQTEFVEKKQKLYGDAFAKNTSLADEFAKKNFQLARDLKNLNEWFNSLFTSESVTNFITSAAHNAAEFVKVLPQMGDWLSKNATYLWLIAAAALGYWKTNTGLTASIISQTIAKQVSYQLDMLQLRWLYLKDAATKAYALTTGVLTGQITWQTAAVTIGTRAWAGLTAVMAANPIGLVIAGLAGLVAGIKYFSENSEKAMAIEKEKNSIQKQVQLNAEAHAKVQKELNEKLNDYNNLSVTERANLEKTIALKLSEAQARLASLKARAHENAIANQELTTWEKMKIAVANPGASPQKYKRELFKAQRDKIDSTQRDSLGDTSGLEASIKGYADMQKQIDRLKNPTKTGGKLNTITDPEEAKRKKKSASDKAAADAKREAEELERLLGEARKTAQREEETDYEKSVMAFAAKYTKMYELAGTNADKIKEIETLSMVEMGAIVKEQHEKELKAEFEKGQKELEILRDTAKAKIDLQLATGQITEGEANTKKLAVDQTYLADKQRTTTAFFADLETLYKNSAGKLKKIESDKQLALGTLDKDGEEQKARTAENNKKMAEKALFDDLTTLERQRQEARLQVQQDLQSGRINEVQAKNREMSIERQFLADKHRLQQNYYDALLKMGSLSADQIKAIEQEKAKALGEIDSDMMNAQQKQYEGRLGGILKMMDEYGQYMQEASTVMNALFQVDQSKLGVGDQLTELDKLQNKTNLTAAEQERMQKIIAKIGETMPGVVTGTNSYGEAISINTDAARKEVDAQRARAKVMQRVMQAEKAWALARVSILYGQTLMQAIAAGASIPFPGNLVAIAKSMAIPTLQYGASIAKITSAGSGSVPAFADGGFTGSGDGPGGFVNDPTLFEMGRRRYVAGEAGREFVISNRALQNPVVANFAGMMDVAQRNNNYSMLGAGIVSGGGAAAPGSSGNQPASTGMPVGAVLSGFARLEEAIREQGSKQVVNNIHAWEQFYGDVQTIRNENTIKHSQAAV